MSNGTFPINMRDIKFILYEQLGIERLCQFEKFKDYSRETFDMVLEEGAKIATEVIAPLNSISDKEGCTYEKGKVILRGRVDRRFGGCRGGRPGIAGFHWPGYGRDVRVRLLFFYDIPGPDPGVRKPH
jgi:hypothetical protein